VVGFNFRFGKGGKGDAALLQSLAEKAGAKIDVVEPVMLKGQLISSSYIRQLLVAGDIKKANYCLGSRYFVSGIVEKGKGRGNGMGIPTANIRLPEGVLYPAKGVYATNTLSEGKRFRSVTNVGINPTFSGGRLGIETHVCGLERDLYGCFIRVEFFDKMREEKQFKNREELRKQIELDIKNLENYF
jgi:riboflavin kinase/FMN adenylyltransferase